VLPVDVNFSRWDCTLENSAPHPGARRNNAVRLGLRIVKGLSQAHAERIAERRRGGPFQNLEEFARRTGLSNAVLSRLAKADAFGSLGLHRRAALWQSLPPPEGDSLLMASSEPEPHVELPPMSPQEE